ncbi:hypothetical protein DRE_05197 [Drechslerella stenobrocha 248]|uniref:Uncharacterized protein n=1 Tax=Drechslerella stenobrocha 248 TaxID=1043628 RepID=W7HNL0_9PEZI|nr:hypothetical protein DRE_05197 [Drechslerella stenobrocha 248]
MAQANLLVPGISLSIEGGPDSNHQPFLLRADKLGQSRTPWQNAKPESWTGGDSVSGGFVVSIE